MTLQHIILNVNAIVCFLIAVRIFTFRRGNSAHSWVGGFSAYILIVACIAITVRIITGEYQKADLAETTINITLCVALYRSRGNVMNIFRKRERNANQ